MKWWKKIRLGLLLAVRIQAVVGYWRQAEVKDRLREVMTKDPVLGPLLGEVEAIAREADRLVR